MATVEIGQAEESSTQRKERVEKEINQLAWETICFVLGNLLKRQFLRQLAKTGNPLTFEINQQERSLTVRKEKTGPDDQPVRFILLSRTVPETGEPEVYGILTDPGLKMVLGIYRRLGESQLALGISPLDLVQTTQAPRTIKQRVA